VKRYYYHVSYYISGKGAAAVGDCIIDAPAPIKTAEAINTMREKIAEDKEGTVVILSFQLLRIEGVGA
jgi:hypothetical protein